MENNLDLLGLSGLGIGGALLNISLKNYEINKQLLELSKNQDTYELLNEILKELIEIKDILNKEKK